MAILHLATVAIKNELRHIISDEEVPGMGVCVIRDARIERIETAGERRAGNANPIAENDRFHIGSCTKFMTTCLTQMAVDEGRLSWNGSLEGLGNALSIPVHPDLRAATVGELLTCTAGLPEDRDPACYPGLLDELRVFNDRPRAGRRRLAERILGAAEGVRRDGDFRYSNVGYCLVGAMLEEAWVGTFEALLMERLFAPLHMDSAVFGPPVWIDRDNQPWGHLDGVPFESVNEAENPLAMAPSGTVSMNLRDMGRYLLFVMGQTEILDRRKIRELMEPGHGGFGRGWPKHGDDWSRGAFWLTSGSNGSFLTVFLLAPGIDFALAVSVNAGGDDATQACQAVIEMFIGELRSHQPAA